MEEPETKLLGHSGDSLVLLVACQRILVRQGHSEKSIQAFVEEATAKDFQHLLAVCVKWCSPK